MQFTASYLLSDDYLANFWMECSRPFLRRNIYLLTLGFLGIACGILLMATGGLDDGVTGMVTGAVLATGVRSVAAALGRRRALKQLVQRSAPTGTRQEVSVSPDLLRAQSANGECALKWSAVEAVIPRANGLLIHPRMGPLLYIPDSAVQIDGWKKAVVTFHREAISPTRGTE